MVRRSSLFLIYLALMVLLLGFMFAHASYQEWATKPVLKEKGDLVRRLDLTDLCLFTEASYTRHLSQADFHTAFQDHPFSLEHFPSGSMVRPSAVLQRKDVNLD
jgi:hypothetical protein